MFKERIVLLKTFNSLKLVYFLFFEHFVETLISKFYNVYVFTCGRGFFNFDFRFLSDIYNCETKEKT